MAETSYRQVGWWFNNHFSLTRHDWREWGYGAAKQPPEPTACGGCGLPKSEHPSLPVYVAEVGGAQLNAADPTDDELTTCACRHRHLLRRDGDVYASCTACDCDHFRPVHNDALTEAMARPNWPEPS